MNLSEKRRSSSAHKWPNNLSVYGLRSIDGETNNAHIQGVLGFDPDDRRSAIPCTINGQLWAQPLISVIAYPCHEYDWFQVRFALTVWWSLTPILGTSPGFNQMSGFDEINHYGLYPSDCWQRYNSVLVNKTNKQKTQTITGDILSGWSRNPYSDVDYQSTDARCYWRWEGAMPTRSLMTMLYCRRP